MADMDRRAVSEAFGGLAADMAAIGAAVRDAQERLEELQRLFLGEEPDVLTPPAPAPAPDPPAAPDVPEPPAAPDVPEPSTPRPPADEEPHEEPGDEPAEEEPADEDPPAPEVPDDAGVREVPPPPRHSASRPIPPVQPVILPDLPELEIPDLYLWQVDALEEWHRAGKVGVVEAVTGAGKTRVGLAAMANALIDGRRVVIITPTQGLVSQWEAQVRELFPGVVLSTDHVHSPGWHVLIDTVHTIAGRNPLWPGETALLVADEAHRYGAPTFALALREQFGQRLGLSATFERGDEGDAILESYFKGVCFRLGYERALADRLIAPFRVLQLGVPLTAPERAEYDAASEGIKRAWRVLAHSLGMPSPSFADVLAFAARISHDAGHPAAASARTFLGAFARRRDVLARVSAKVTALESLAPAVEASGGTIVFTGTTVSAQNAAEALSRAGCASAAVHGELGQGEVEERLELLRSGATRSISAPRILDEGVDVPDADLGIILAASKSRRQMIQRLGRVVRRKADGRSARLVVLYAIGTSEDPGSEEAEPHLAEIVHHAEAATHMALPDELDEALTFLRG